MTDIVASDVVMALIQVRLSISRAIAKETPRGFQITKEKSTHKIDIVIALAMAAYAAVQSPMWRKCQSSCRISGPKHPA